MKTNRKTPMTRKLANFAALAIALLFCAGSASAQDWFKTGTGLGVSKVRLAVPEFSLRAPAPPALEKTFHDVLWSDLEYCGILDLVSPSFYPPQSPSQPSELKFADWANAPSSAYMVAYGNLSVEGSNLAAAGFLSDVHNPSAPIALQKIYRGAATDADARRLAHQFADDIVSRLSGGSARYRSNANRLREHESRKQRNLGHGLRRRKSASAYPLEIHLSHAALVT